MIFYFAAEDGPYPDDRKFCDFIRLICLWYPELMDFLVWRYYSSLTLALVSLDIHI